MPYKDKERANEASRLRMQRKRQGVTLGVTKQGVTDEGVTWETMPIKDIKEALPDNIVEDIIALGEYDRIRHRPITLEERFRRAYKYQVWYNENFINAIHKDSKYRQYAEATR